MMTARYGTVVDFILYWTCVLAGAVLGVVRGALHGVLWALVGAVCGYVLGLLTHLALCLIATGVYWRVGRFPGRTCP